MINNKKVLDTTNALALALKAIQELQEESELGIATAEKLAELDTLARYSVALMRANVPVMLTLSHT